MLKEQKLLVAIELLPFLSLRELAKICRLNKASYHLMKSIVNFEVLFKT
jgi:hypothetical protein